ncbi:MAG: glycerate kinase [Actinobacteria bacterium]|nr:glycerate kinase [Actinomycetota bacterium]
MPPRFLIAPDSFKGTFASDAVAAAIGRGVTAAGGEADLCPAADGGEGTAAAMLAARGGTARQAPTHDPLGRPIEASYVLLDDGTTAVIDAAAASGLPLLAGDELDPERASSRGTGELILAAVAAGARRVLLAAGGTATMDAGLGAIEAVEAGGGPGDTTIHVLCDVTTPFEEAPRVFGPQKGADAAAVERLRRRFEEIAATFPRDPRGVALSGCAGGLSGGLWAALGASLEPGAAFVLDVLGFERRLGDADAAISGEGGLDSQSFEGKLVGQIAATCLAAGKDLHLAVGRDGRRPGDFTSPAVRSVREATTLAELEAAGGEIAAAYASSAG